jgi:hypothetical protein
MTRRYLHGDGNDDVLLWHEGPSFDWPRFPHVDWQGSDVAVVGAFGNLLEINTYDPFGIPGANNGGRFQYAGQAWNPRARPLALQGQDPLAHARPRQSSLAVRQDRDSPKIASLIYPLWIKYLPAPRLTRTGLAP